LVVHDLLTAIFHAQSLAAFSSTLNAAVLVDETLPSRLGTLSACNVRIATGTGIASFDFLIKS
jgi:hypothetical protein